MPTFKIKNISTEDIIEPYFHVTIKAGATEELESKIATRVLAVFPFRAKIVTEDGAIENRVGSTAAPAKPKKKEAVKAEEKETKTETE